MKTETNKELILGSLFESPKTTGQLARGLNYVNKKGTAGYSQLIMISKKLHRKRIY